MQIAKLSAMLPLPIAAAALLAAPAAGAETHLRILQFSDVSEILPANDRPGLDELTTLIRAGRAEADHHVTVMSGDFLSPSLLSGLTKGAPIIAVLNAMGVDVAVFGNHEFDFGPDVAAERIAESAFPWLGTNVIGADGKPHGGAFAIATRQVEDHTVGFLGLLTPDTVELSSPGAVRITDPVEAAAQGVEALRARGADVIIAVTHMTFAQDREVARQVDGIDVILGGHDHLPIDWYEDGVLIHKSGAEADWLGVVDLTIDTVEGDDGPEVTVLPVWRIEANRGIASDPVIGAMIDGYAQQLDAELAIVIGKTTTALDSRRASVRGEETAIGNLVADAIRESVGADIGLTNGGGIRGDRTYEAGVDLTRKDILSELPFGNVTTLVVVSGANLVAALENGVSQVEEGGGRFPQVSGLSFTFDASKPAGSRVSDVKVGGRPVDPGATYKVATNDFMLNGGDGYTALAAGTTLIDKASGTLMANAVMSYIESRGEISPTTEGRIVRAD